MSVEDIGAVISYEKGGLRCFLARKHRQAELLLTVVSVVSVVSVVAVWEVWYRVCHRVDSALWRKIKPKSEQARGCCGGNGLLTDVWGQRKEGGLDPVSRQLATRRRQI